MTRDLHKFDFYLPPTVSSTVVIHLKMLIVVGGFSKGQLLDTTELLRSSTSTWENVRRYPYQAYGLRAASVANRLFTTGGFGSSYNHAGKM